MKESSIIDVFTSEKDLFEKYPKEFHWFLNDIFNDYWDSFVDYANSNNLTIRPVVFKEVNKMRICKTKALGYSYFECPNCHRSKFVYNTCKGRFCNSCGIKYAKQRTTQILSTLVDVKHRHLVFTMPDILWSFFLKDRSLLHIPFEAVSQTILSWFSDSYKSQNFKPGFILVLHTFGRDDKWNVHIHCLIAECAFGNSLEKKIDFFPYDMLRKRFQTILLNLMEQALSPNIFRSIKNKCYNDYSDGFYVRAKKSEFPNSKKGVEYVLRYCGRPCFAQYRIIDIVDDYILFWYQRHEDDFFVVEKVHIFEFIGRLIRHIPEENFKTIRYYGFYSSKKHPLYSLARKIIEKAKVPFYKSLNKWRSLMITSFNKDPLKCFCGSLMIYKYSVPRLE